MAAEEGDGPGRGGAGAELAEAVACKGVAKLSVEYLRRCTLDFSEVRLVGEGGSSKVLRGEDPEHGLVFAVKRLDNTVPAPAERRAAAAASIAREIDVLRRFRHPNIISLMGFALEGDEHLVVFELGAEGSLAQNLADDAKAARLTPKVRVRIAAGIARALNYLHRHGAAPVFHRDVKSANVVLCTGMVPKLIDCGLSLLLTEEQGAAQKTVFTVTQAGALGTPGYMCPTYMRTRKYGERSEVFGLGMVLLELLTGRIEGVGGADLYGDFVDDEKDVATALDARAGEWGPVVPDELASLSRDCLKKHKERPTMTPVVRRLGALERDHCAITLEEELQRAQLVAMQGQIDALRLEGSGGGGGGGGGAAAAAEMRTCCICFCDEPLDAGIVCGAAEAPPHFCCDACFAQHVGAKAGEEARLVEARGGYAPCPGTGDGGRPCAAPRFSDAEVLRHVPDAVFARHLLAKQEAAEARIERVARRGIEEEVERRVQQRVEEDAVGAHRTRIVEGVLTLHCPCCALAFFDFDGCFALGCTGCGVGFCAYCLQDCGETCAETQGGLPRTHNHVRHCEFNIAPGRDVFGTALVWAEAKKRLCDRELRAYLDGSIETGDGALRDAVVAACAQDLRDLGLKPADYASAPPPALAPPPPAGPVYDAPAAGDDDAARAIRRCTRTLAGHTSAVYSVCAVSAGVVASASDETVRLWDVASGACLHTLAGHTNGVVSVCAVSEIGRAHV